MMNSFDDSDAPSSRSYPTTTNNNNNNVAVDPLQAVSVAMHTLLADLESARRNLPRQDSFRSVDAAARHHTNHINTNHNLLAAPQPHEDDDDDDERRRSSKRQQHFPDEEGSVSTVYSHNRQWSRRKQQQPRRRRPLAAISQLETITTTPITTTTTTTTLAPPQEEELNEIRNEITPTEEARPSSMPPPLSPASSLTALAPSPRQEQPAHSDDDDDDDDFVTSSHHSSQDEKQGVSTSATSRRRKFYYAMAGVVLFIIIIMVVVVMMMIRTGSNNDPLVTTGIDDAAVLPTPAPSTLITTTTPTATAGSRTTRLPVPTVAPTAAETTVVIPTTTTTPTTTTPSTAAPTTMAPTTAAPTTATPTTVAPTTAIPTTVAPTTAIPTTLSPTTATPTQAPALPTLPPTAFATNPPFAAFPDPDQTLPPTTPLVNTACETARGPLTIHGAPLEGVIELDNNTDTSTSSDVVVAARAGLTTQYCPTRTDARGLWYIVTGGDEVLRADTCGSPDADDNDTTTTTTQITIYTGSDCDRLFCVAANTGLCGSHSSVSWYGIKGVPYWIHVTTATTTASVLFALRVTYEDNGDCANAIPLADSAVVGSLRGADPTDTQLSCSFQAIQHGFVWYTVVGTGHWMMARTCQGITNFDARLDVQVLRTAACRVAACPAVRDSACGGGHQMVWWSEPGTVYHVLVFKLINLPGQLFELSVQEFEPVHNDDCVNATAFDQLDVLVQGSTLLATHDEDQEGQIPYRNWRVCRFYDGAQPGVWYTVTGTGERFLASTCHDETDFASEITVFTGTCDQIDCVPTDRQACGDNKASVYWQTAPGQDYLIMVHGQDYGVDANVGHFGLTVGPFQVEANDLCADATAVTVGETVTGSTFFATPDNVPFCDDADNNAAAGVWYTVVGTGQALRAATCDPATDFDTKISVFQGSSCQQLECVIANDNSCGIQSSVRWTAREGQRYYILVHGRRASMVGDFALTVELFTPTVPNDFCDDAVALAAGDDMVGSTRTATFDNAGVCGAVPDIGPGVWYVVNGTGKLLTASLCHDETDYDTALTVYSGPCDDLVCVTANADYCGRQSQVSWVTQYHQVYYLLVHGYNIRSGQFGLTLTEPPSVVPNDYCVDAIAWDEIGPAPVPGTVLGATADRAPVCLDFHQTGPGVWYTVVGTGKHLVASTCHDTTTLDTLVSVYTGAACDALSCVRADDNSCVGGASRVVWLSQRQTVYYVLVHARDNDDNHHEFALSIDHFVSPQPNDVCVALLNMQYALFANGRVTYGSTIGASFDDMPPCGVTNTGPGVWYIVFGTGERLKVDTCHPYTNFDTKLSVFTGLDCDTLQCIEGNDDGCGLQSSLTFDTQLGELYYVLIHGWGTNREGNFGVTVSGSVFF